jgi:peptidoglycan/LPS O-acetylase OafA/YrhL
MKNKLTKLEGMRGFAALYVFADHLLTGRLLAPASPWRLVFDQGFEVVMLFFLLSGFVIFYSQSRHEDQTFKGYFLRRAKRIYPIYLLALLATYAANCLSAGRWLNLNLPGLLGNIFMLQDTYGFKPGVRVDAYGGNISLWSLSYEWWFYLMFWPIYRHVKPGAQWAVAAGLSAAGGVLYCIWPNQAALFLLYFIIWWCGVEMARIYGNGQRPGLGNQWRTVAALGVFCVGLAATRWGPGEALALLGHPVLRQFASSWIFLVVGLGWSAAKFKGFGFIPTCFAWAAPISYALYALHYPLAVSASYLAFLPGRNLQIAGYVLIVLLLSYWSETVLQRFVNSRVGGARHRRSMS